MIPRRYAMQVNKDVQLEPGTTFQPYWVGDAAGQVAVLGRNERTGKQVWSGTYGYPGDFVYREFHRKDGESGLQYWRIGGKELDLGEKPPYEPEVRAAAGPGPRRPLRRGWSRSSSGTTTPRPGKFGVISSAYDTELFGHWWFEGADWLKAVLERLAKSETVELTTASSMVESTGRARCSRCRSRAGERAGTTSPG
jgi:1,4-alpha-glucan branching enzyme